MLTARGDRAYLAGRGEILHGLLENTKVPRYCIRRVGPGRHGVLAGHSARHRSDAAARPGRAREDLRNDEGGQTFFPKRMFRNLVGEPVNAGDHLGFQSNCERQVHRVVHRYARRERQGDGVLKQTPRRNPFDHSRPPKGDDRIDAHRVEGRNQGRGEARNRKHDTRAHERHQVGGGHAKQL
jgi:hypothetical protein